MRPFKALLCFISTLVLVACGEQTSNTTSTPQHSEGAQKIKTYKHSEDGVPTSLDPIKASSSYSGLVVLNVFDTLFSYQYLKRPYQLKPNLAQALPTVSEDGLKYTITIKSGVHFHDHPAFPNGQGRVVTANDFIYSLKRSFDPANNASGAWLWQEKIAGLAEWKQGGADYDAPVSGLKAIDEHTLEITLTQPYPQLTYTLAMPFSAIVPREVVEHSGLTFGSNPIGSGPFILQRFDNDVAYFIKNPAFRNEPFDLEAEGYDPAVHADLGLESLAGKSPPFIDRLEVHFIRESSTRWNAFTKGNDIQYTTVPKDKQNTVILDHSPLTLHPQITENYHHRYGTETGFVYSGFNMDDPTFGVTGDPVQDEKNKALRCAIRKAHDWTQKNRAFYFGLGSVFPGIIPPSVPEYDPDLSSDSISVDIEGAKKLLSDAGWSTDQLPTFEYHVNASVQNRQTFSQMRGFLGKIGYPLHQVEYHPYPSFGAFYRSIQNREAPFFFMAWTLDYPDAENTLQLFYGPNQTPGANHFNYQNLAYDALYQQASTMLPSEERTAIYRQMNQMVIDDCVLISGLSRNKIHLWHKNVITYPDRQMLGGGHLRYVDVK